MADTAYQVLYRDEWIAGFERGQATMRRTVVTEAMVKGRQAVFLVATSGNASAVTRGNNGLIPARLDDLTQSTATLTESHDLSQKTGFNLFAGQSDQRAIMQSMNQKVINRSIDTKIITVLNTATVVANATASIMTKQLVNRALTTLYNANVENDGLIYGAITPAAWAHLSDIPDFASADYVSNKPNVEGAPSGPEMKRWLGVTWFVHTLLPGTGTSAAKNFIYHRNSMGHAYDSGDIDAQADYDREQDYSWSRATIYDGAVLLQNSGIVVINHDDSAYSV
jgi:hypothetical protein